MFLWRFILIPCYSRGHLRQGVSVRAARRMDLLNDMDLRIRQEQINGTNKPSIGKPWKIIRPQKNEVSFLNLVGVPVHMTVHKHKAEADFLSL